MFSNGMRLCNINMKEWNIDLFEVHGRTISLDDFNINKGSSIEEVCYSISINNRVLNET